MSSKNALYDITTRMDRADYKRFSYLMAFRKKVQTISLIVVLAAVGAGFWVLADGIFSVPKFLILWPILIAVAFAAIFLRVEYKALNRSNGIRAGIAGDRQHITFYEHYLIAEEDYVKGSNKIKYDNLYQALETNDYYIIFANANSASMIRKKDIDEEDQADFEIFLKQKLGERYKNLVKNR